MSSLLFHSGDLNHEQCSKIISGRYGQSEIDNKNQRSSFIQTIECTVFTDAWDCLAQEKIKDGIACQLTIRGREHRMFRELANNDNFPGECHKTLIDIDWLYC